MNKSFLALTFLSMTTVASFGADLPSRKAPLLPPPPPPPPIWTGLYLGLNAGYGWSASNTVNTTAIPLTDAISAAFASPPGVTALANAGTASVNQNGFVGGGQIGFNWQFSNVFVAGVEADIQGSAMSGGGGYWRPLSFHDNAGGSIWRYTTSGGGAVSAKTDYIGTVRGRIGYLFTPVLLVYGTGGLAYGGVHGSAAHGMAPLSIVDNATDGPITTLATFAGVGQFADTRVGWTAGGGLEWLFAPNWSVKAEALYYDLGRVAFATGAVGFIDDGNFGAAGRLATANALATSIRYNGIIARAGVNYHFTWGAAPVVAKF